MKKGVKDEYLFVVIDITKEVAYYTRNSMGLGKKHFCHRLTKLVGAHGQEES